MPDKKNFNKDDLMYFFLQFSVFIIILILIILRLIAYKNINNAWIWIVNYIGMGIAVLNLLANKCFELKSKNNKKFKPFVGFTIFSLLIVCLLLIPIYFFQTNKYCQALNDIITLLALLFSLSDKIWDSILNKIVEIIK